MVSLESLMNLYPQNISQKIDMILLNIETRIKYIGGYIKLFDFDKGDEKFYTDFFIDLDYEENSLSAQYKETIHLLEELELIKSMSKSIKEAGIRLYTLRSKGWEKVYELKSQNKEYNNQIVPEIFYEIKNSSFIIADLTGHRTGVYYEAGYAEALGIEVILTCRVNDFNNRHFDVAQKNTIVWEDETDLYNRLMKRIKATVGHIKQEK